MELKCHLYAEPFLKYLSPESISSIPARMYVTYYTLYLYRDIDAVCEVEVYIWKGINQAMVCVCFYSAVSVRRSMNQNVITPSH